MGPSSLRILPLGSPQVCTWETSPAASGYPALACPRCPPHKPLSPGTKTGLRPFLKQGTFFWIKLLLPRAASPPSPTVLLKAFQLQDYRDPPQTATHDWFHPTRYLPPAAHSLVPGRLCHPRTIHTAGQRLVNPPLSPPPGTNQDVESFLRKMEDVLTTVKRMLPFLCLSAERSPPLLARQKLISF